MKSQKNESSLNLTLPGLALSMALSQGLLSAPVASAANDGIQSNHPILSELLQESPMTIENGFNLANYDKCHDRTRAGGFEYSRERSCPKRSAGPSASESLLMAELETDLQAFLS